MVYPRQYDFYGDYKYGISDSAEDFSIKGTEGTQIIEHDWERIKNTTDRYKVSKMEIKIFRYKIIEDNTTWNKE